MAKTAAIFSKPGKPELAATLSSLTDWLKQHQYSVFVDQESAGFVHGLPVVPREEFAGRKPDMLIVLGGDGTLLAAARAVVKAGIPILAVNLGSLGFLTEVPLNELFSTLEALHDDRCHVEHRSVLQCQLLREGKCVEQHEALNDVVLSKGAIARMTDFDLHIDGAFVSNYKADGLIIATPTGSTAYSLAAGGPIVAPDAAVFIITPVSPHSLTNRPLVVRDSARIEAVVRSSPEEVYLTVDGQVGIRMNVGDRVVCGRSQYEVKLLRLRHKTFFDVLRNKLKWGER